MKKKSLLSLPALALVLALSACGGAQEAPITETEHGEVQSIMTPAGLSCVVFNPSGTGGGIECDFAEFTAPSSWNGQVGTLETVDADNGYVQVVRVTGGPLCVTLDGSTGTGAISCDYLR